MDDLYFFGLCIAFIWGALWGSFANVCIFRIPRRQSIISPRSHCPQCMATIPGHLNIPILSWFLLRGRCRYCKEPIEISYIIVELSVALLAAALFHRFSSGWVPPDLILQVVIPFLYYFLFAWALVVITFIDLQHYLIPNVLSLSGAVMGVALSFVVKPYSLMVDPWSQIIGCCAGGGVMLLFIYGYFFITRREGMGGGDFKLMMMIGAFLGWQALPFVLFASSIQGIIAAGVIYVLGIKLPSMEEIEEKNWDELGYREDDDTTTHESTGEEHAEPTMMKLPIPFGPFMALAALEFLFFRDTLAVWYNELLIH